MRCNIRQARFFSVLVIAVLAAAMAVPSASARSEWSPMLGRMAHDSLAHDRNIAVLVFLDASSVRHEIHTISVSHTLTRSERIKATSSQLHEHPSYATKSVAKFLSQHSLTPVRQLWIASAMAATIPASKLEALSDLEGVQLIIPNVDLELVAPVSESPAPSLAAAVPNVLTQMNVPTVWRRGLTGKGRLVCSFDTGVQQSHPALSAKWRGRHASLHAAWFSTIQPDTLPFDKAGHGTHTMGIMVGSTPSDSFGVAPDAEWITAGVIDQGKSLNLTIADILAAFQWALDPDGDPTTTDDVPDVILNSWGIPKGLFPPCDPTFATAISNVEAAGIVTIFAAGNEGPNPSTLRQPADNASTPLNCFSVGAVDSLLNVAAFSSRGPSYCDSTQIKPEIVAPGVNIRSSTKGSAYMYMSGTSMAAPFVAGVVALLREYNPDATVDEIKQALISSARDIGVAGEDNASGHGFIDAAHALDFMPLPEATVFSIAYKGFEGSGLAMPGSASDLTLTVTNSTGKIDQIIGRLAVVVPGTATVQSASAAFSFGIGGTTAIATPGFTITFDSLLPQGTSVPFRLYLVSASGLTIDSLDFNMICGISPAGAVATHSTQDLSVGVSDFGQYGLASGSIYNVGGAGFHFRGGPNLLYEAGVVIGRNSLQVSSAIRDSSGKMRPSDFVPSVPISSATGSGQDQRFNARIIDSRSEIPIPITISQETVARASVAASDILIFRYSLVNTSTDKLTGLRLGFLSDFDLGSTDTVGFDFATNLLWQGTSGGPYVGLVGLKSIEIMRNLVNGVTKSGYTKSELYHLISTVTATAAAGSGSGDEMLLLSSSSIDLYSGDSSEVAFALVAAANLSELLVQAGEARNLYLEPTGVDNPSDQLPIHLALAQNYPNPFNPTTTISFELPKSSHTTLAIFNVLGQQVRTLIDGPVAAGNHTVVWDGLDDRGDEVSSGVYLYRLTSEARSQCRKMVLVR